MPVWSSTSPQNKPVSEAIILATKKLALNSSVLSISIWPLPELSLDSSLLNDPFLRGRTPLKNSTFPYTTTRKSEHVVARTLDGVAIAAIFLNVPLEIFWVVALSLLWDGRQ